METSGYSCDILILVAQLQNQSASERYVPGAFPLITSSKSE